eukprot:SAG11_NODE_30487_length_300_cov_1.218905_2_plen_45_part_01
MASDFVCSRTVPGRPSQPNNVSDVPFVLFDNENGIIQAAFCLLNL